MLGWNMQALLILTALTFPHFVSLKYPGKRGVNSNILDAKSYDKKIGRVNNLTQVGKLTGLVLKETDKTIEDLGIFFQNNRRVIKTP